MKTLFAAMMLIACATTAQANVSSPTTTAEPTWLKDMQTVSCKFGMCKNWHTQETFDDEAAPDGWTVVFPETYDEAKLKQITPAVMQWIKVNGIPKP